MAASKLSAILSAMYLAIEQLTPEYESGKAFARYTDEIDLSLTDPGATFRAFRIVVVSTSQGPLHNQRYKRSRSALLQVQINYPLSYQIDGDADYLGVEMLRQDDGRLIEDALCHKRPDPLQAVMTSVSAPQWRGSFLLGRLWCVTISIDWMEDTTT